MATLDDILTTQKNGVIAINALTQALNSFLTAYQSATGTSTSIAISSASGFLVKQGSGRVVNVNVIEGGSSIGYIYDLSSVPSTGLTPEMAIAIIPATTGAYPVNCLYSNGIIVATGTGQTASLTYA